MANPVQDTGVPISRLPEQSEELVKVAKRVYERFNFMKLNRNKLGDAHWDKYDQMFRNEPSSDPPEDWMANVFVPFVMSVELAVLSEIASRRMRWRVLANNPDDGPKAEVIQAITEYTMDKGYWDDEFFKFTHSKLHYGTAVWKEVYREDRRVIKEVVREKGKPNSFKEKDIREFQDVYGYEVNLRDFYLDDRVLGEGIKGAEDCLERKIMRIDLFRTRFAKYRSSKGVKEWGFIKPILTEAEIAQFPAGGDTSRQAAYMPIAEMADDEVEVLDYWNKLNDEHIIIANGVVVVQEPNPYDHKQLPYALDIAVPIPNSPYGMGIPQILEAPQEELNTYHNLMLDVAKLDVMKPTFMGGMSLLDEDEYQLRPKIIIPVDDVSQIYQPPNSGIPSSSFQMFEEIKQTIRTGAGLDVRFAESNSPQGGSDTATEVMRLQEASLRRIGLYVKILEIRALPRIAKLRTANIQQFYRDPLRIETLLGPDKEVVMDEMTGKPKLQKTYRRIRFQPDDKMNFDFMQIDPEMVRGDVDVMVVPQSTQPLSQAVIAKRMNTALQTILSFPPAMQIVKLPELMRAYFKALDLPLGMVRDIIDLPENNDLQLAEEENKMMAAGEPIPPTSNPSAKHTAVHAASIYKLDPQMRLQGGFTDHFMTLSSQAKEAFLKHINGEMEQHAIKGTVTAARQGRTVGGINGAGGMGGQDVSQNGMPQDSMGANAAMPAPNLINNVINTTKT